MLHRKTRHIVYDGDLMVVHEDGCLKIYDIYDVLDKIKTINKTYIDVPYGPHIIVDPHIWKALVVFKTMNGYAGMTLSHFLKMISNGN